MKKSNLRKIFFIASLIIIIFSALLYIKGNHYWYYPAVVGVWLFFDYLSYLRKNKTIFGLLINKEYKKFFKIYLGLFVLGALIEIVGRIMAKFWIYPLQNPLIMNIITFLFYPFILMSFVESYNLIYSLTKNKIVSTLLSMLIGIIIWEIPNIYSQDWVYQIPYINLEIFNLNIVVVIGWIFLILGPLYVYKQLNRKL
jgi:hypothetical protein